MSLLAVNIAEFLDRNEICEKIISVGLWQKCWWNILIYFAKNCAIYVWKLMVGGHDIVSLKRGT